MRNLLIVLAAGCALASCSKGSDKKPMHIVEYRAWSADSFARASYRAADGKMVDTFLHGAYFLMQVQMDLDSARLTCGLPIVNPPAFTEVHITLIDKDGHPGIVETDSFTARASYPVNP